MTAGGIIRNDSGNIQFTDAFKSMVLVLKGSVTLGAAEVINSTGGTWTTGNMATISVPNTSNKCPVLALSCNGVRVCNYKTVLSGGNWIFYVCAMQGTNYSGTTVNYWAFDDTPDSVSATSGLKIFDAAGKCQFHSSLLPTRVVDYQAGSGSLTYSITVPSGKVYAIASLVIGGSNTAPVPAGTWTTYFSVRGVMLSGSTIDYASFRYMMHQNSISVGSANGTGNCAAMTLDVTNY